MTSEVSCNKISEPNYYHREYKNDIGEKSEERSWGQQCQRVATVALPFFSLYKPLSLPISLGMGALRSWSCINQLLETIQQGNNKDIPYQLLQTTIAVVAFGGTIFAHPAGMLITTGHDLIIETVSLLGYLHRGEHQKALESCGSIINNVLYLALFSRGGIELAIASFAMQIMLGIYHSHGEFQKGNYLEASGHLLMAMIRGNQLIDQTKLLQTKWGYENALKKVRQLEAELSIPREMAENVHSSVIGSTLEHQIKESAPSSPNAIERITQYSNNPKGYPILHYAVFVGDVEAVKVTLDAGTNPNFRSNKLQLDEGFTPLEIAVENNNAVLVSLLLKFGADPHLFRGLAYTGSRRYIGYTRYVSSVHVAIQKRSYEALRALVDRGIDLNKQCIMGGQTGFDVAFASKDQKIIAIVLKKK